MPVDRRNRLATPGSARGLAKAVLCFKTADHAKALKFAKRAARKGLARAQYFLSLLYKYGFARGLAHDRERKGEKRLAALERVLRSHAILQNYGWPPCMAHCWLLWPAVLCRPNGKGSYPVWTD